MQALNNLQHFFETYLAQNAFPDTPQSLYSPAKYILSLGGKRLRPAAALLASQVFDKDVNKALPVAMAVEIFHNFSLVHDDIMDEAPLRRGQATVHARWGINTAVLSGDAMFAHAYQHLAELPNEILPAALRAFNRVAIGVCEGQQYDMDFERRDSVGLGEYIEMIRLKTAVLLGGALEMGALAGGANPIDAAHLYQFGCQLGIAFQIMDDYLDSFGDPEKFGKKVGGDIAQNKKTFLVIKTLERGNADQCANLRQLLSGTSTLPEAEKIEAVKAIFVACKIPQVAQEAMTEYYNTALFHLSAVGRPDADKETLRAFAAMIMQREF